MRKNKVILQLSNNTFELGIKFRTLYHTKQGVSLTKKEIASLQVFAEEHNITQVIPFGYNYKNGQVSIENFIYFATEESIDDKLSFKEQVINF